MTDDHPNRKDREDMVPEVEAFLAHYGVKGMKWGVRRASSDGGTAGGPPSPTRKELRGMNRVARARQRRKREAKARANDEAIMAARASRKDTAAAIKQAKLEYKSDKKMIGRVVARELLDKKRKPLDKSLKKSSEMTRGEEAVFTMVEIFIQTAVRSL